MDTRNNISMNRPVHAANQLPRQTQQSVTLPLIPVDKRNNKQFDADIAMGNVGEGFKQSIQEFTKPENLLKAAGFVGLGALAVGTGLVSAPVLAAVGTGMMVLGYGGKALDIAKNVHQAVTTGDGDILETAVAKDVGNVAGSVATDFASAGIGAGLGKLSKLGKTATHADEFVKTSSHASPATTITSTPASTSSTSAATPSTPASTSSTSAATPSTPTESLPSSKTTLPKTQRELDLIEMKVLEQEAKQYGVHAIYRDNLDLAQKTNEAIKIYHQHGEDLSGIHINASKKGYKAHCRSRLMDEDDLNFTMGFANPSFKGPQKPTVFLNPDNYQPTVSLTTLNPLHIPIHEIAHAQHFKKLAKNYTFKVDLSNPEYQKLKKDYKLIVASINAFADLGPKIDDIALMKLQHKFPQLKTLDDLQKILEHEQGANSYSTLNLWETVAELKTANLLEGKLPQSEIIKEYYRLIDGPELKNPQQP